MVGSRESLYQGAGAGQLSAVAAEKWPEKLTLRLVFALFLFGLRLANYSSKSTSLKEEGAKSPLLSYRACLFSSSSL